MGKVKLEWEVPSDQRFRDTEVVVDANDYEQQALWEKFHRAVEWAEELSGRGPIEIGRVDKRPISVVVTWCLVFGRRVAFVDPTSQLVDYVMVDRWQAHVFPRARFHSNTTNFAGALHAICGWTGRKLDLSKIAGMD